MRIVRALMLVLAVCVCAHAGVMDNGTPQPPPPQSTQVLTTKGEIHTPPLVQIVLSLLALF